MPLNTTLVGRGLLTHGALIRRRLTLVISGDEFNRCMTAMSNLFT
jgi:hypothetical protein